MEEEAEYLDHEEAAKIVSTVKKLIEALHETDDADMALRVLSGVTAFVICNGFSSADSADEGCKYFIGAMRDAIGNAEKMGATIWTRGTVH